MTRDQFIADCRAELTNNPRNVAIAMHLAELEVMTEAQFAAHHATLTARNEARDRSIRDMVASIPR
jgi:hypothetical protein